MTSYALIGDSQGAGLARPFSQLLSVAFSDPRVGWTTARIAGEPLEGALRSAADTIVLVTGGNDDPLNEAAFATMVGKIRAARKQLIVVGPVFARTDDAARHDRARAQLQAAAIRAGVRFIDAYPMTRDLASTDNVHLTAAKYRIYAERLVAGVKPSSGVGGAVLGLLGLGLLWKWLA